MVLVLGIGIVNSLLKVLGEVLGQKQAVLLSKVLGIGTPSLVYKGQGQIPSTQKPLFS